MKGAGGVIAMAIAAMLVCCKADPHQDQESKVNTEEANDYKTRNLDTLGGGNLVRQVRESRPPSFAPFRGNEYGSFGGKKLGLWQLVAPKQYGGYYDMGLPKRNFDEIDRSGLDHFVKKRMDEFPFMMSPEMSFRNLNKRQDSPIHMFDDMEQSYYPHGKRVIYRHAPRFIGSNEYRPDFPMDEIDISAFPIGSKRSGN